MRRSQTTIVDQRRNKGGTSKMLDLDDSFRSLCESRRNNNNNNHQASSTSNASWGNACWKQPSSRGRTSTAASALALRQSLLQQRMISPSSSSSATVAPSAGGKRSLLARDYNNNHNNTTAFSSSSNNRNAQATHKEFHNHTNLLLKAGEINSLLQLLQTNEFAGKADPLHHSSYLEEPTIDDLTSPYSPTHKPPKKKVMMRSSHQSETHLLTMKEQRKTNMIPAWAS